MKFTPVKRPRLARAKAIRRNADICPWCGAVESFKALRTKRTPGAIIRYSICKRCKKPVTRIVKIG